MKRAPAEEPTPLPSARSNTPQGEAYTPRHCLRGFAPPKSTGPPREEYRQSPGTGQLPRQNCGQDRRGVPVRLVTADRPSTMVTIPAIISTMFVDEYIPVSTAKSHLLDVLRRIEEQHSKVVITKNGVPKAVLLPYQDFEGLRETIDILADPAMVEGIREGLNDVTAGRVVSLEEAFAVVLPTALAEFP